MNTLRRFAYAAVELMRTAGAWLAHILRWVIRRPRNVIIAVSVLVVVSLVWLMGVSVSAIRSAQASNAAAASAEAREPLVAITALPVDGASSSPNVEPTATDAASPAPDGLVMGTGPQAAAPGQTLAPAKPADIPAPTQPTANTAKADEVATAWAKAYFSRPDGKWDGWVAWVKPLVSPNLLTFMTGDEFNDRGALDGAKASTVVNVKLSPSDGSTGRDTPVRWSRTAAIDVKTADGRVTTVSYIVEESLTDTGWLITSAEKKGWTVK